MPATDYDKLAAFYDGLVLERADVVYFRSLARDAGGAIAEFMAGSGRVSVAVAGDGIDLTCVDSSTAMLVLLRAKLAARRLQARLVCGDVAQVDLGATYRLVFVAYHSLEELITDSEMLACLVNAHRHLDEEARFVCTLHDVPSRLATIGAGKIDRRTFIAPGSGKESIFALQAEFDAATGVVSGRQSVSFADRHDPELSLPVRFRLIRPDAFSRLVSAAGLEVESVLSDFTAERYEEGKARTAVWTLRRPPRR